MKARLLNLATVISVLLFVGVLILWAVNQFDGYGAIYWSGDSCNYAVASKRHWVIFGTESRRPRRGSEVGAFDIPLAGGFPRSLVVAVPHSMFLLAFGLMPVAWVIRKRRGAASQGHCPTCGYDLRASE